MSRWIPNIALTLLLAGAAPLQAPSRAAAESEPPSAVVETLHETLIGVMKDAGTLGYDGRYDRLAPVLNQVFDIPFMAEKSVGRHWKTASEAQRAELLGTFNRFIIANYAGRFDGYGDQSFETLGEEPSIKGTMLVRTRLVEPGGDVVQLNYRLRQVDGDWKIIDIYLNGTVSELALRRSEYSTLIQREGFGGLLAALDEKIADLSSVPASKS